MNPVLSPEIIRGTTFNDIFNHFFNIWESLARVFVLLFTYPRANQAQAIDGNFNGMTSGYFYIAVFETFSLTSQIKATSCNAQMNYLYERASNWLDLSKYFAFLILLQ